MLQNTASLHASLACSDADIRAAQRLRYRVFVQEMGAGGPGVDHARELETDRFDPYADHLLLRDTRLTGGETDGVVGVYRLMTSAHAQAAGQFYSASEFDLSPMMQSDAQVLELGRSCLHPAYRGGAALLALWQGLARYVQDRRLDLVFGVASFPGADIPRHLHAISHLHAAYLAPPTLRVTARMTQPLDVLPPDKIDRKAAMRQTPALIKSYLKIGGVIGQGVYVDHAFNTTDICLILETRNLRSHVMHRASEAAQ
ncbi:GNAT family N-acetyltransferase [Marivita sp. S0852]|uniref:GNAT family N-acetyltransferase n=1 Tax=Marivita sp. S0852 TaxID=3373893 RepID=UPI003981FD83